MPSSTCTSDTNTTGEERKIKTCNKLKEKQVMKYFIKGMPTALILGTDSHSLEMD